MGIKKLAQVLQIKEKEAKSIFANYFETFPTIKEFLSKTNDNSNLVATTICLRKRYFYPNSYQELDMAKREIFNSIFQGSTADLIKLAMVKIDEVIYKEKLPAKMLLQIHDELIFEVQENQIEQIKNKFKTIMENQELINGIKIDIPIVVNAKIGKNWRFMK
jgi:DNA polymerase-1